MWDGGLGKKSAVQLLRRPEGDHPLARQVPSRLCRFSVLRLGEEVRLQLCCDEEVSLSQEKNVSGTINRENPASGTQHA